MISTLNTCPFLFQGDLEAMRDALQNDVEFFELDQQATIQPDPDTLTYVALPAQPDKLMHTGTMYSCVKVALQLIIKHQQCHQIHACLQTTVTLQHILPHLTYLLPDVWKMQAYGNTAMPRASLAIRM